MLFNSLIFLGFFPLVTIIFWLLRYLIGGTKSIQIRNIFLLIASYYFYMCWQPTYALLLLFSTTITYSAAILIEKVQQTKLVLLVSIILNLSILFFFKYFNFAADCVSTGLNYLGINIHIPSLDILLPVGISFYIFQALGYLIDVYRKEISAEHNIFTYALFVSFFPQLVAGPIERSKNLLHQFHEDSPFNEALAISGFKLMLWGYFIKLCIADRCAMYVDPVFNNLGNHEGMSTLIASLLFTFQIYGDFAGYTFIAIGCARILGYTLNNNFRRPYFASTITEFWRRWHISLSSWLRDYVYFPLGGSKGAKSKTYRNILVTFIISGIWHGANWTFIVWGTFHGGIQCIERWLGWNNKRWNSIHRFGHILFTLMIVSIGWTLFRANSLQEANTALQLIFSYNDFSLGTNKSTIIFAAIPIIIMIAKELMEENKVRIQVVESHPMIANYLYCTFLLVMIGCFGVFEGGKFIYFQF